MNSSKYTIDQLPELPLQALELGGKLGVADTEPILTIRPLKMDLPVRPSPKAAEKNRSEFSVRKYLTQVLYPKVWCYPPNDLVADTLSVVFQRPRDPLKENELDPQVIAKHEQFYKLSKHNGVKLSVPYFCRIHYGPWSGIVVEEEACNLHVPSRWTLIVHAIPELVLIWDGLWEDIPSYPNLHVIMGDLFQVDEARICCPGFTWCAATNSCIPLTVPCKSPDQV